MTDSSVSSGHTGGPTSSESGAGAVSSSSNSSDGTYGKLGEIKRKGGLSYYNLSGFYPPTDVYKFNPRIRYPQVISSFVFEGRKQVYEGRLQDERYEQIWSNPLNPFLWSYGEDEIEKDYKNLGVPEGWGHPHSDFYYEGDRFMSRYFVLQGCALVEEMDMFIVPAIVRGLDPLHTEKLTSLIETTPRRKENFVPGVKCGGGNMWHWMDICNIYEMLFTEEFSFAWKYRYWLFICDIGREQKQAQGYETYWLSHANIVIIDRRDLHGLVYDPNTVGNRLPGGVGTGYSLLPVDVGGLLSLFNVTKVWRVRGGQAPDTATCGKHCFKFVLTMIGNGRLPDPVECHEYFQLTNPTQKAVKSNLLQERQIRPTRKPILAAEDTGCSTIEEIRARYNQQKWRQTWQDSVSTLLLLLKSAEEECESEQTIKVLKKTLGKFRRYPTLRSA